ncbi:uncharacterized protein N7482_004476 [Penicillium canariense]|uniref:non-specific serine/threonine protein kinase n=1 Tax=Penicillium canariense TaxID=189055 RepID=A0A9W9LPL3_9EURO|nr:uncharacterized protein N7482_004476 [Penicillium canariense]KAJ5168882.1 hypothetical protein N7482_004476 [Penicillium canariense]
MTVPYGKKIPRRRSVFNLWIPNKVTSHRGKQYPSPADSAVSDSPVSPESIGWGSRDRFRVRLTRSGSKFLLLLGLRTSSNSNKTSVETTSCDETHSPTRDHPVQPVPIAEQDAPIYISDGCSPVTRSPIANYPGNAPLDMTENLVTSLPNCQSPVRRIDAQADGEDTQQYRVEDDDGRPSITVEPQTASNSRLVDRVSQRLSLTFGQPTVVRRTHLRPRPSVLFLESPISRSSSKQGDEANNSSDPLTTPSSGISPIGCSTTSTPVTSGEPSPSLEKYKTEATEWPAPSDRVLSPISESDSRSPIIASSIMTVEAASVAKIYLELCFNSIFENVDSRVQRQHELEQHIYAFQLGPKEQIATRRNWALQENEYLRQCRILKTCFKSTRVNTMVSLAGYEVIKALGKGSFGVVYLVRERESNKRIETEDEPSTRDARISSTKRRHLEIIRSTIVDTMQRRRRFMAGEDKEVYAMKVIKKSEMIRNCQEGHIRAERDFLVASEKSRWIVPLISSFQDDSYLYLVMDYMVGGDFLGLLIRKAVLREEWTRFYIAEMVLCIEEAHRLCWIHRDVKPDNFLISASGHLKISDFGLAFNGHWSYDQTYYNNHRYSLLERLGIAIAGDAEDQAQTAEAKKEPNSDMPSQGPNDLPDHQVPSTDLLERRNIKERRRFAKSVVGTSQYMAPEVIRGEMYDGRCDWWSLGIILYEVSEAQRSYVKDITVSHTQCLYGFTPFACESRRSTKIRVLQHSRTLQFPRETPTDKLVSQDAIDLIARILQEREFRLCSQKYHANDMLIGRPVSDQFLYSMHPRYRKINSYWVYPDDAADIKVHPFFRGIQWNKLHLTQPPLIPRVKHCEDTRYFDDWKEIDNIEKRYENSDTEEESDENTQAEREAGPAENPVYSPNARPIEPLVLGGDGICPVYPDAPEQGVERKKKRERNRPRDKILRDKKAGRVALEMRKRGAFLGYTYRRPKGPAMALSPERGRQPFARGALTDLYVQ